MTNHHDPSSHDRDNALHRAWRASSHESPPSALDDAILAAAHRAVGSKPRRAGAEALRPPKWWLPFAAAAVIGVVAVGVVQIAPHDTAIDLTSGETRAPAVDKIAAAKPNAEVPVARQEAAAPSAMAEGQRRSTVEQVAPAAAPPASPAPANVPATKAPGDAPPAAAPAPARTPAVAPAPAASPAPAPAPSPVAAPPAVAPAPAPAPAPATPSAPKSLPAPPAEPMPFPAAPPPLSKLEAAREARKDILVRDSIGASASAPAESDARAATPLQSAPAPRAAKEDAALDSAAAAAGGAGLDKQRVQAQAATAARAPSAPVAPAASPPPPPSAGFAGRSGNAATGNLAQLTKPAPAARAEAIERAKDPDAWIERIRKLRDGGREDQAIAELREFDMLVPDAKQRMPSELRRLMEAQGTK